jgi:outer membrane protein OmpA-like peptidoglycan-associated protein
VPVVAIPQVASVQGPPGWSGPSIPTDTFFAFGSYTLLPGADTVLQPIATKVATGHLDVEIEGFSSPETGTAAYNQWLSAKRAKAVETRLISLGVAPGQILAVRGEGTGGKPASACYRHGRVDESACAALRHVVILLREQR